jgi:hypothetical protein
VQLVAEVEGELEILVVAWFRDRREVMGRAAQHLEQGAAGRPTRRREEGSDRRVGHALGLPGSARA